MWLSLIPQLHSFDDAAYLPMRHHHFTDDKPEYFDGEYDMVNFIRFGDDAKNAQMTRRIWYEVFYIFYLHHSGLNSMQDLKILK